jgi:2-keto-4-pentenoate hydratase
VSVGAVDDLALVKECLAARDEPRTHTPPSERRRLGPAEAYGLQDRLREALIARGERVAGWKAGFTTRALQETFEVSEPVCAFLLAGGVLTSGATIAVSQFVKPGVEAEVAFVMKHDLAGPGVTAARALLAVEGVLPALELIDFRHSGKALGTDVIADGVYAKAIVLGGALTPVTGIDLALEGLVYEQSGVVVGTATAAEVLGTPLNSLVWIANHLGARGLGLCAGDVVMTGSVSKVLQPKSGDTVRATYTRLGSVSVRFA